MGIHGLGQKSLKLNFSNDFSGEIFATQADTGRSFEVRVLDATGQPANIAKGHVLKLYVAIEGEVSVVSGVAVDGKAGVFRVDMVNSQLKYSGKAKAQFTLEDGTGSKIGSKIFDVWIEPSIENGATVGRNILIDFTRWEKAIILLEEGQETLETMARNMATWDSKVKTANEQWNTNVTQASQRLTALSKEKEQLLEKKSTEHAQALQSQASTASKEIDRKKEEVLQSVGTQEQSLKAQTGKAAEAEKTLKALYDEAKGTEAKLQDIIARGDLGQYVTKDGLDAQFAKKLDAPMANPPEDGENYSLHFARNGAPMWKKALSENAMNFADQFFSDVQFGSDGTTLGGLSDGMEAVETETAKKINELKKEATPTTAGLMSAADKKKLDKFSENHTELVLLSTDEYSVLDDTKKNDRSKVYLVWR